MIFEIPLKFSHIKLVNFNGMAKLQWGILYPMIGNDVHCAFIFTFSSYHVSLSNTNNFQTILFMGP